MFTVRATKKLLGRINADPSGEAVEPTTRLGDWYANLLFTRAGQVVLFVNERSLLSVLLPAKPASTLLSRFQVAVPAVLSRIGIAQTSIRVEQREMAELHVGRTRNRRVLGTMNDFALLLESYLDKSSSLEDVALRLADVPCGPLAMGFPAQVAQQLLGASQ